MNKQIRDISLWSKEQDRKVLLSPMWNRFWDDSPMNDTLHEEITRKLQGRKVTEYYE